MIKNIFGKKYNVEDFCRVSPEIARFLNKRLEEWAEWFSRYYDDGIGYAKQSTEYKMMKYGLVAREYIGKRPLPVNDEAEEIENLIRVMAFQNTQTCKYAVALREYYIYSKQNKRRTARALGVSEALLRIHLENAQLWLSGWFIASYGSKFIKLAGRA